ncbi:L,D-transpeptidase family protein [Streptomonospora nanhaiensis]|uniref:L,D-transpeptidase family protein n=2 Tax=Streptomonospora nanhaiensis TaxID=1323731 RepID=UPI001C38CD24|nr:L,D-transpeptidase family protein [Streptomonospora nanhaiensis]MBV2361935.1 L,D-transpeptidase family protein [Streptomonospora nanhaiensis]
MASHRPPHLRKQCTRTAAALALAAVAVTGWAPAAHAGAAPAAAPGAAPPAAASTSQDEPLLSMGDSGPAVREVEERLKELGYWLGPVDGEYDVRTAQAVMALQKVAGIDRDSVVGPDTRAALEEGPRPQPSTSSGVVLEIDLDRQVLLVVRDGEVRKIFNTSTGSGETYFSRGQTNVAVTPEGEYSVFRRVDGWDDGPLGSLYRPAYFNGGIAIHGYSSVPGYPASHGCARVSLPAMDWLWANGRVENGAAVVVR